MRLVAEVVHGSLPKAGEELCGDKVEVIRTSERTTVVLSDGLGSGVKANILATLTTKIAAGLLERKVPLEEVISTIAQTLPICHERLIAYSTLAVVQVKACGLAHAVLLDSPSLFLWRRGKVVPFPTQHRVVAGRDVEEGELELMNDDFLLLVSDGVLHAGIGGLLPLGLGEEGVKRYLKELLAEKLSPQLVVQRLLDLCAAYYTMNPGDDTTVVAINIRLPRQLVMLTGPPRSPELDPVAVGKLLEYQGKKVVCGGTTAQIVARELGRKLTVELTYDDPDIPPCGFIEGIDVVTEGMLTLNRAQNYLVQRKIPNRSDGASRVAQLLSEADEIKIVTGLRINPAHQNPDLPQGLNLRAGTVKQLAAILRDQGKVVDVEWL
ncbi:MAG TPA: SpoIIE family protein phosphatase [Firmicutes bacterium]|nr:SpoIIE family protein phosphatase [Bacillota bacterium]